MVAEGHEIAKEVRHQLLHHLPHLGRVMVHVDPYGQGGSSTTRSESTLTTAFPRTLTTDLRGVSPDRQYFDLSNLLRVLD